MSSRLEEGFTVAPPAVVTSTFYHAPGSASGDRSRWGEPARFSTVLVALCQINPTVGDFEGNCRLILDATVEAERRGAELGIFPELALSGYPPKDLLQRPAFVEAAQAA